MTFDQYKQDQVVQMHFTEKNGQTHYGFSVFDRPDVPISKLISKENKIRNSDLTEESKREEYDKLYQGNAQRAFMGKDANGDVSVKLMDSNGNQRIRMVVDNNDIPRIEFLNESGEVTYKLPPEE